MLLAVFARKAQMDQQLKAAGKVCEMCEKAPAEWCGMAPSGKDHYYCDACLRAGGNVPEENGVMRKLSGEPSAETDPMTAMLADLRSPGYFLTADPVAEPTSRGGAPSREGMTDRAKENLQTLVQKPAAIKQMKKGPQSLSKEVARSSPEASKEETALLESAVGLESEIEALTVQIAEAIKALTTAKGERQAALITTLNTLYEVMDKNKRRVVKFKDQIVAADEKRDIKSAAKSPAAIKKSEEIQAKMDKKKEEIKALAEELAALTEEQFVKYGGVETEKRDVAMFPNPDMAASLAKLCNLLATSDKVSVIRAGVLEMLKSIWNKLKTAFSGLDDIEKDVAEYEKLAA